jgi:choline dehydrogenase
VLANRLSADGKTKVLLLEAGGDDRPTKNPRQFISNLMIHVPVGYSQTLKDPKVNWLYPTEPDPGTGGRVHVWPRGKVLGGSSSINGLLYIRGQHADYDGWRQLGCEGWGWDDVRPYFLRAQHQERGAGEHCTPSAARSTSPTSPRPQVSDAVIEACVEAGIPAQRPTSTAPTRKASAYYQLTVKNGQRCSAAVAYLHPAMGGPTCASRPGAGDAGALRGQARSGSSSSRAASAAPPGRGRGVILAGGAVNSPQLLQLSGVGPAALLAEHGIAVVSRLPGVGENLQDHYVIATTYRLKAGTSRSTS